MNGSRRTTNQSISLGNFFIHLPCNLVFLCLALLASTPASAEDNLAAESKKSSTGSDAPYVHLKRAAIWVPDLDRAIVFYRDVLGFRLNTVSSIELNEDSVLFDMFNANPSSQIRRALFSSNTEERALFVMETPVAPEYAIESKRHSSLGSVDN